MGRRRIENSNINEDILSEEKCVPKIVKESHELWKTFRPLNVSFSCVKVENRMCLIRVVIVI